MQRLIARVRQAIVVLTQSLETRTYFWLTVIVLFSLLLRMIAWFVVPVPEVGGRWYRIAVNVAEGKGYVDCIPGYFPFCGPENNQTATSGPVPILIFAALIFLFDGFAVYPTLFFQMFLGLMTIMLVYFISQDLFGKRTNALVTATLWGMYYPILSLERIYTGEPIAIFFLCLSILALLKGYKQGKLVMWLLAGVTMAFAVLSRSAFTYFPLLILPIALLQNISSFRRKFVNYVAMLLVFVMLLSPWVLRNWLVFGGFIPGISLDGYNLFRNHYFLSQDDYLGLNPSANDARQAIADLITNCQDLVGNENEFAMGKVYQQEAFRIIQRYPDRYLMLSVYRFIPFLTDYGVHDISQNLFWTLAGLENIGLWLLAIGTTLRQRKDFHKLFPVVFLLGYYAAGHLLINAQLRYIVPIMPLIMVLAIDQLVVLGNAFLAVAKVK